jgi:hypothetical protein
VFIAAASSWLKARRHSAPSGRSLGTWQVCHIGVRYPKSGLGEDGPVALVEGEPTWEERQLAARIVARYGKGKDQPEVTVEWREGDLVETYAVPPEADEAKIESLRI